MNNISKGRKSVIEASNRLRFVIGSTDLIRQPSRGLRKQCLAYKPAMLLVSILIIYFSCFKPIQANSEDLSLPANSDDDPSKEVGRCEICQLLVGSYEKGIDETSRGKHEGGDTSWEERNLKSYSDSEVRLVEIQERICEDVTKGKAQCLSMAEDTESAVEDWCLSSVIRMSGSMIFFA